MKFKLILKLAVIFAVKGGGAVANLLIAFLLSKFYPSDISASFFHYFSIINIFGYVARWGADHLLSKVAATDGEKIKLDAVHSLMLFLSLILSAILTVAFDDIVVGFGLGFCIYAFAAIQVRGRVAVGLGDTNLSAFYLSVAFPLLSLLFATILAVFDIVFSSLLILVLASSGICILTKDAIFFRPSLNGAILSLKASNVFFWAGFLNIAMYWGGQFIGGMFLDDLSMTVFGVVQRLSGMMTMLVVVGSLYVTPKLVAFSGNRAELMSVVRPVNFSILFISSFICMVLIIEYELVFNFFGLSLDYSREYFVMVVGQTVFSIFGISLQILNMTGNELETRKSVIVGAIVFSIISFVAVLEGSFLLLVCAVSTGMVFQGVFATICVKRKFGVWPWFLCGDK